MNSVGDIESTYKLLKKIRNVKMSNYAGGSYCDYYIEEQPKPKTTKPKTKTIKPKTTKPKTTKPKTTKPKTQEPEQELQKQQEPELQPQQELQKDDEPELQLQTQPQQEPELLLKKDNDLYIMTDKGRYVLKRGMIGKKIIQQIEENKNQLKEHKKIARLQKKQQKKL